MKGIEAACVGKLRKDAELRETQNGRQWLAIPLIVGEEDDAQYVAASAWAGDLQELAQALKAGTAVYVEGKIRVKLWDRSGERPVPSIWLTARTVQPMGLIGERRPKRQAARKAAKAKTDVNAPLPFDDPIDDIV